VVCPPVPGQRADKSQYYLSHKGRHKGLPSIGKAESWDGDALFKDKALTGPATEPLDREWQPGVLVRYVPVFLLCWSRPSTRRPIVKRSAPKVLGQKSDGGTEPHSG
jgi:hypothetical protein